MNCHVLFFRESAFQNKKWFHFDYVNSLPSSHLFITFGLYAHHSLIRLTQTLVFLSNPFSFFQSWSSYSPHYLWEWQKKKTHTHTHLITLISNLKNLGMVCLHWQNKVIYPSHSAKLLSQFLTYSPSPQAPNTSKNFLFPERNHLYILTWRLIYIKTQLIRELFLSRSNTDECSMCTEQGNAYFLPLQLNGEETLNK